MVLRGKPKDPPSSFGSSDVAVIHIISNLISSMHGNSDAIFPSFKCHCGMVRTFKNVLVKVFDGLNRGTLLHIDMSTILLEQQWVVWNNMDADNMMVLSRDSDCSCMATLNGIVAPVDRI